MASGATGRGAFLRVGLLIVGGFAAILFLVLFLSGDRFKRGLVFETYFTESIQGLEVGAPVKYRGVSLGRVTAIGLVSAEYGLAQPGEISGQNFRLVFVRFTVDPDRVGRMPDTETATRSGLRARVAAQGITGLSYVELDFVAPGAFPEVPARPLPWTPVGAYIPSVPSTLSQVQDAAQQFLAKLNKIDAEELVQSLITLVQDVRTNINSGDIHTLVTRTSGLIDTLQQNVTGGDIRDTLHGMNELVAAMKAAVEKADVPALANDFRATSGAFRQLAQSKELQTMLANVAAAAERLAAAAGKLQPVIASLEVTTRRVGDGTADLQQAIIPLLRDAQAAAANLRETTDALRQYPAGTLLGGPPPRNTPERAR